MVSIQVPRVRKEGLKGSQQQLILQCTHSLSLAHARGVPKERIKRASRARRASRASRARRVRRVRRARRARRATNAATFGWLISDKKRIWIKWQISRSANQQASKPANQPWKTLDHEHARYKVNIWLSKTFGEDVPVATAARRAE